MNKFFTKIAGLTLGLAMAIGVGVALGSKSSDVKAVEAATTVQYDFQAKEWTAKVGSTAKNWDNGKSGASFESANNKRGIQVTTSASGANGTCNESYSGISKVTVGVARSSGGAGTVSVSIGDTNCGSTSSFSSTTADWECSVNNLTGFVKITVTCTSNSVYVKYVKITYDSGGGTPSETITTGTTDYIFNSKSWGATVGSVAKNWTSGEDGNALTSGQGIQITTGVSGANATSPATFENVKTIVVTYCTNASSGKGTIKVQVGTNAEKTFSVEKPSSGGTTLKEATFSYNPRQAGVVKVTAICDSNSMYIYGVSVTCQVADSISSLTVTNPKTTFTVGDTFTHVKDNSTVVTATYATAGAKTVTSGFTYTLGGVAVTTSYTMAKADNGKTVVVTYTDSDGLSKAADGYAITVNYEDLDDDELTMTQGPVNVSLSDGTVQLTAEVTNPNADPTITWSSDNTNIATVDQTGLVTLKAAGDVDITASADNNKVSKTCAVSISATPTVTLDVTSISDKYTGDPDVTITPDAKNVPNDAVYIWTSTNTKVATVTKGTGNVGIVHFEGTSSQNESITLTIKNAAETETLCSASATLSNIRKSEVLDLTLSESAHTLYDGKFNYSFTLTATINDEDVIGNANKNITWTSSDPTIADVDNGEVVVLGEGGDNENPVTVTITAASTYSPSVSKTCTVTVLHDTVNKITWNGKNTPSSFYTGDILGEVSEASNWEFDAEWTSGVKEEGLSWGTGSNVVHLNKCADGVNPTTETDNPLDTNYKVVIGDNNKRLVPFYGEFAASAKVMKVNQSAVSDIEVTLGDRIVDNKLDMYDTEVLTLDYTVTYVGNVNDGVDIEVSDENKLLAIDNGTDGHGNGTIAISGDPCNSVTLTLTSKEDSSVKETITIHIIEDEVLSLSWTGSGVSDVLEYESDTKTLGEVLDSSNWTFSAHWNKKDESDLTVGSGDDNVNLGIFNTAEPSAYSEGTAYNASAKLDINLNGKYLIAFYKGARAEETIKINIVKTLKKIETTSSTSTTYTWTQTDSTNPFGTSAGTVTLNSVDWTQTAVTKYLGMTGSDQNRWVQIGKNAKSGVNYSEGITLKTSKIEGTIKKVTVECASGDSKHSISIAVGGVSYLGSTTAPSWNGSTSTGGTVFGEGSNSGEIVITVVPNDSEKAFFLHEIEVEYTPTSEITNETGYEEAQFAVVQFAQYMNSQMNGENVCSGTFAGLKTAWDKVAAKYDELFGSGENALKGDQLTRAKALMTNAEAHWDESHDSDEKYCLEKAMKTYEWCTSHYSSDVCSRFMSGVRSILSNSGVYLSTILNIKNSSATIIVVVISAISAAAIGGYFLFRKKKED